MALPFIATFTKAATTAVALGQTTAGAGSLLINGTLGGVFDRNIERTVSLTVSGADLSSVNVTIVGTDVTGAAVTETRVGPNSNTVYTTAFYHTVTSVTVDAAVGTAMSVGSGTTGRTCWYKVDGYQTPIAIGMSAQITATISVTGQYTYDNTDTVTSPVTFTIPQMSAITATGDATIGPFPVSAIRGVINSSSGNGAVTFNIIQAQVGRS